MCVYVSVCVWPSQSISKFNRSLTHTPSTITNQISYAHTHQRISFTTNFSLSLSLHNESNHTACWSSYVWVCACVQRIVWFTSLECLNGFPTKKNIKNSYPIYFYSVGFCQRTTSIQVNYSKKKLMCLTNPKKTLIKSLDFQLIFLSWSNISTRHQKKGGIVVVVAIGRWRRSLWMSNLLLFFVLL